MRSAIAIVLITFVVAAPARAAGLNQSYLPYLGHLPPTEAQWFEAAFDVYAEAFIEPDGRVVDPQNGGITHSESQGYGLLLALLGNDPATFERIWQFARFKLQRADKLFAWKWVPGEGIADRNNATDGEMLIATALALAGMRWENGAYMAEAEAIADAIGRKLIMRHGRRKVILPGEWAAPSRYNPNITLNLSYYIPLTFPVLQALAPRHPWDEVLADGLELMGDLIHPPSDWSTINDHGEPVPAPGFPRRFSYDAVRIPLYLLQNGMTHPKINEHLFAVWGDDDDGNLFTFDVYSFKRLEKLWGNSYQFSYELLHCAVNGEPVSYESLEMKMDNYFDSSLHLLAVASMYADWPECFPGSQGARPS